VQLILKNEDFFGHFDFLFGEDNRGLSRFHLPEGDLEGRVTKGTRVDLVILPIDQMIKYF
jgi:hypothetical protein